MGLKFLQDRHFVFKAALNILRFSLLVILARIKCAEANDVLLEDIPKLVVIGNSI